MIPIFIAIRLLWTKRRLLVTSSFTLIGSNVYLNRRKKLFCDEIKIPKLEIFRKPTSVKDGFVEIVKVLRRHLLLTFAATGTAILSALMSILSPIYISKLIDGIAKTLSNNSRTELTTSAITLVGISLINAILTGIYIKLIGDLGERISSEMRTELFERILHETVSFFDNNDVSELLSRLTVDVQSFKHSLKQILTTGVRVSVQLASSVIQMGMISQSLTMSIGASLPFIFIIGNSYGQYLRILSSSVRDQDSEASNLAHEALINIKTVKSFVNEDFESERYADAIENHRNGQSNLFRHIGIFQGLNIFSINTLTAAVLYLGGIEVLSGSLSSGGLFTFLISLQTAQRSLTQFVTMNAKWQSMLSDFDRIGKTLTAKDELEIIHEGIIPKGPVKGCIEFKNVTFTYNGRDRPILNSTDLKIFENEVVGIIGDSGTGKSTLISLINRFYEPKDGKILVDGNDLKVINLKWLRKQIGIVPQDPVLFSGTIRENISYGSNFNELDVINAAKQAHIHDFISSLPQGYSTHLNKCSLSGGQKQRIAIARVLLRSPKILIFDEATSALDMKSETSILETLKEIKNQGKTIIIITHKKTILELADRVFHLIDGKFKQISDL